MVRLEAIGCLLKNLALQTHDIANSSSRFRTKKIPLQSKNPQEESLFVEAHLSGSVLGGQAYLRVWQDFRVPRFQKLMYDYEKIPAFLRDVAVRALMHSCRNELTYSVYINGMDKQHIRYRFTDMSPFDKNLGKQSNQLLSVVDLSVVDRLESLVTDVDSGVSRLCEKLQKSPQYLEKLLGVSEEESTERTGVSLPSFIQKI